MTPSDPTRDLPERVVVGANGAYWRDYGDHYSMVPVSEDNDPVEVVAVYKRFDASDTSWDRGFAAGVQSRPETDPWDLDPDLPFHPFVGCPQGGCALPANHDVADRSTR